MAVINARTICLDRRINKNENFAILGNDPKKSAEGVFNLMIAKCKQDNLNIYHKASNYDSCTYYIYALDEDENEFVIAITKKE